MAGAELTPFYHRYEEGEVSEVNPFGGDRGEVWVWIDAERIDELVAAFPEYAWVDTGECRGVDED